MRRTIFIGLGFPLSFHCRRAIVFVLMREISMHGLFMGNGLLRSVVSA